MSLSDDKSTKVVRKITSCEFLALGDMRKRDVRYQGALKSQGRFTPQWPRPVRRKTDTSLDKSIATITQQLLYEIDYKSLLFIYCLIQDIDPN